MDRLKKVVGGFGGAVQAVPGTVMDLARAPFVDDEMDGFVNTLYRVGVNRGGQVFENLIGPNEGIGAAIGGMPKSMRSPLGGPIQAGLAGSEFLYREVVAEGASTALTAASISDRDRGNFGGFGGLFDPDTWKQAHSIAQNRSPGQAFALAIGTRDVLDEEEVAAFAATDQYEVISGVSDAVLRLRADPTVLAGRAAGAARTKFVTKPITTPDDINRAMGSTRIARFKESVADKSAAEIRQQFFPDHKHGAFIAVVLEDASKAGAFDDTMRALMGERAAVDRVYEQSAALGGQLARLHSQQAVTLALADDGFEIANSREFLSRAKAEVDELYPEAQRAARMEAAAGTIREVPRSPYVGPLPAASELKAMAGRSEFYQSSPFALPVRVFDRLPQRMINLHDQSGDVQVARMLKQSDLPLEVQHELRGEFMRALDPGQRQTVLIRAEEAAVKSIAEKAGMTVEEIDDVLREARRGRDRAGTAIRSRAYDADGKSRVRYFDEEAGEYVEMAVPLWVTQEVNALPMVDMRQVKQAASSIGRIRLHNPAATIPVELMNSFYKVWRPSVLLRAGWPMRVVGDEQLRILAKIGALGSLKNLRTAAQDVGRRARANTIRNTLQASHGKVDLGPIPQSIYTQSSVYRGYDIEGPYGKGDAKNLYEALNSSKGAFDELTGATEKGLLDKARGSAQGTRTLTPFDEGYSEAWTRDLNLQIGQDAMGRKFLAGGTVDEVETWLRTTAEGQRYAGRLPTRTDLRRWAEEAQDQVERYTLGNDDLKAAALRQAATPEDLARIAPDASQRPNVHGEALAQALGTSESVRLLNRTTTKLYSALGSLPTDVLSRNPFFAHMYGQEVKRLIDLLDDGRPITPALVDDITAKARDYALGESKVLLYDLADRSRLADMLKFAAPFYMAWEEVITRWAGLAIEKPAFAAQARQVWNSPEKAGIVTDENGSRVDANGNARNALGEFVEPGSERFLTFSMPEWVDDIPGMRGLSAQGSVRFGKEAFNLALSGTPGFGPPIQVLANEVAKDRPELEQSLEFVLPFGSTQDTLDLLLPATAKRLRTRAGGEEDRVFTNTTLRIYHDAVVDYNLGRRPEKPTYDEAVTKAKAFYSVRMFASWISPAAPNFQSPYQLYIDAYRQLRDRDPETADEKFLSTFGEEFFPLTQSLSKSMDGVPPTLEGFAARKRYQDLIEKYPDLGGLIVGSEGAGEFARAVYDQQLAKPLRPGSGDKQRQAFDFETAADAPDVRLGWIKYRRLMDLIEVTRVQRGLPNMQVKAAADLRAIKANIIADLATKHPAWHTQFSTFDRGAWAKRLAGFQEIVQDRRLAGRDDIRGLAEYLNYRELVLDTLAQREHKTLNATANRDLAEIWENVKGHLVESNLSFSALFFRYLESDPMLRERERGPVAA